MDLTDDDITTAITVAITVFVGLLIFWRMNPLTPRSNLRSWRFGGDDTRTKGDQMLDKALEKYWRFRRREK